MRQIDDAMSMAAPIIIFSLLLLAGVLSVLGPDTRDYDVNDRRGWWPGRR
jgi:hypothetical protein